MRPSAPVDSISDSFVTVAAVIVFSIQISRETPRKPPSRFVVISTVSTFVLYIVFKFIIYENKIGQKREKSQVYQKIFKKLVSEFCFAKTNLNASVHSVYESESS